MSATGGGLAGLIHCIHASRTAAALALTGGGTGAIPMLLRRPGGSSTVLDIAVPYSSAAVAAYLGEPPRQATSAATAEAMARRAFQRACELRSDASIPVVGLGATAALTTDRVRRGTDRLHVATFDGARTIALAWTLEPPLSRRREQEAAAERAIVASLADAVGVAPWRELAGSDLAAVARTVSVEDDELAALHDGAQPWLTAYPDGRRRPGGRLPTALVSGSFNPWHRAHQALWEAARRRFGDPVAYELSITNVDKPPLPSADALRRAAQFSGGARLILTTAPTFLEKARLLPGTAFVIGADTARRVIDPVYYGGVSSMRDALRELRSLGARFVVAGRREHGRFVQLSDLTVPPEGLGLFEAVPADELRVDISSTELRAGRRASA